MPEAIQKADAKNRGDSVMERPLLKLNLKLSRITTRVCATMMSLSKFIRNRFFDLHVLVKNSRGQMAIFIALIFQVLFMFFAMAINIGMAVHDKINLQNATDLAAFYVAQKQAEILDVIAHTNYQIRQSYKVLNFRYYYLGTLGYTDAPSLSPTPLAEQPYPEMLPPHAPTPVCIAYGPMWDVSPGDNICKKHNYVVQNITIPPIIAAFLPTVMAFNSVAISMQNNLISVCQKYAAFNWWYAALMYVSYDIEQAYRKQTIHALANNLGRPLDGSANGMVDIDGGSIFAGAQKTFLKNLTYRNRISNPTLQLMNPMEGKTYQDWLPDIDAFFTIPYQDITGDPGSCTGHDQYLQYLPSAGTGPLNTFFGAQNISNLIALVQGVHGFPQSDPRRLSLGVEKNPWYLIYAGAKGTTQPTQLFSPFAGATYTARAFAQPFGGRIGPWYGNSWPHGATMSAGNPADGTAIEPMAPPRYDFLNSGSGSPAIVPGYSRFPGDYLGETSMNYLSSLSGLQDTGAVPGSYNYYSLTLNSMGVGTANDMLAYDPNTPAGPVLRNYEIAAAAPDLFDITYYSIQPSFGYRYLPRLQANSAALGIPGATPVWGDIGSRAGTSNPLAAAFSVSDQIAESTTPGSSLGPPHNPQVPYYVVSPVHLLTSWVTNPAYAFYPPPLDPQSPFGKCETTGQMLSPRPPGDCANGGGRTGYSVKLVSPSFLNQPMQGLGGGDNSGQILDPPPANF